MRAFSLLLLLCLAAIAPSLALPAAWKLQKLQDDGDFHFAQCAQDPVSFLCRSLGGFVLLWFHRACGSLCMLSSMYVDAYIIRTVV
jgi:hypothetical protein